jgi:hypothetical protein
MSCKDFLSDFYKLLNVYKKNENDPESEEAEDKLVKGFTELDYDCKRTFFITVLSLLANKPETVLSSAQEQELEVYNRKSLIDLKNSSTKIILVSMVLFIFIVYITPSLLDSPILKSVASTLADLFSSLTGG